MAKNDDLNEMAKRLLGKRNSGKKSSLPAGRHGPVFDYDKQKWLEPGAEADALHVSRYPEADADYLRDQQLNSAAKPQPKSETSTAPKVVPKKSAAKKPAPKVAPKTAKPKKALKAPMADDLPPPPPKAKAPSVVDDAVEMMGKQGDDAFSMLEHDLPKGGSVAMHEAAELAPGAAEKSAMRMMKLKALAKPSLGKAIGTAGLGVATGLGLSALMEGLNAEDSNPPMHDKAAEVVAKRSHVTKSPQMTLPQEVKKVPGNIRQTFNYGPDGPTDQQKLEDEFAKEMMKYPR